MKSQTKTAEAKNAKAEADKELDEALEESFPASDPLPIRGGATGAPEDHASTKAVGKKKAAG
jgi:hypothetical protein